jgi:hypothetical protein
MATKSAKDLVTWMSPARSARSATLRTDRCEVRYGTGTQTNPQCRTTTARSLHSNRGDQTRMSSVIRITPIALLALLLPGAEAAILTLSCDGTVTNMMWNSDNRPEPITKMGLLVNLPERTVTGFAYPARIDNSGAVYVEFSGKNGNWSVHGTIDRSTGSVEATTTSLHPKTGQIADSYGWDLICKSVGPLL